MSCAYKRLNINEPLVPPKPNELHNAWSAVNTFALLATKSKSHPSPGSSRLMVGGAILSLSANIVKMASTEPAAPNKWPVIDLVELTNNS